MEYKISKGIKKDPLFIFIFEISFLYLQKGNYMGRYCILVSSTATESEFIAVERMGLLNASMRGYRLFHVMKSCLLKEKICLNLN
jgi:hypothetical protein